MTPEQFWRLNPVEFWWMLDARRPRKKYGSLSEDDVAELYDFLTEAEEDGD